MKRQPVWVLVYWSESGGFKDNELIPFKEFESRCKRIALNYRDLGYLKTKYKVLFADGAEYDGRLDLAENDDLNYRDSMVKQASYYRSEKAKASEYAQHYGDSFLKFYDLIVWGE